MTLSSEKCLLDSSGDENLSGFKERERKEGEREELCSSITGEGESSLALFLFPTVKAPLPLSVSFSH